MKKSISVFDWKAFYNALIVSDGKHKCDMIEGRLTRITIEIFSVGDSFSVNIMQRNGYTKYVDRFSYLLDEMKITYTAEAPEHFRMCGIKLPD